MGALDINYTFFIQLGNFIIALIGLNYLLIKPVREQISARNALTNGYLGEIEKFTNDANNKLSSYEATLDKARIDAAIIRDELKVKGHCEEQGIVQNAHAEAASFLKSSKEDTAKKIKAITADLMKKTPDFAKQVVSNILK